jgi:hypothetical protein
MKSELAFGLTMVSILTICSLIISGCTETTDPSTTTGPLTTQPAKVGALACLMKDDKPYIMVNMAPELPNFGKAPKRTKEDYLLRRAAEVIIDFALAKEEYDGKASFVLRMVLLDGKDDYNRPKWGSAVDLAFLELKRDSLTGLTKESLANLDRQKFAQVFSSIEWK